MLQATRYMINGFTLAELLVVVSIIAVLTAGAVTATINVSQRAQVEEVARQVEEMTRLMRLYHADTGQWPPAYRPDATDDLNDNPFLANREGNNLWKGPYTNRYTLTHRWRGQIGCCGLATANADCSRAPVIIFDDDRPNDPLGNSGQIPVNIMQLVDERLDDGNLATGRMVGNAVGNQLTNLPSTQCGVSPNSMTLGSVLGEFIIRIDQ